MTLSSALNNAVTGLRAATRQADLISNNVANALTEGYGRREISLSPVQLGGEGGGVRVAGVSRVSDPVVTASRRLADAALGAAEATASTQAEISTLVGEPGEVNSLTVLVDNFDAAITLAADTPESSTLLSNAADSAADLVTKINVISDGLGDLRSAADAAIFQQVEVINTSIADVRDLNAAIAIRTLQGEDFSALDDERQRVIDRISELVPLNVVQRDQNQVAIFTTKGGQLLNGVQYELEFSPTPIVTQTQSVAGGGLSGLSINGETIPVGDGSARSFFDGGALEAQFRIRDEIVPEAYVEIDALARNLIERVQDLPEDPTLAPGDPGLFTDAGAAFDPLNEEGIAGRVALNVAVDLSVGGDPSLLRDGLNSVAPGDLGDGTILIGLKDAVSGQSFAASGTLFTGARSFAGFVNQFSSATLFAKVSSEARSATELAQVQTLSDAETNLIGVDTDAELSRLLIVEQTFTANARVVQVVDELLERLIQIV